MKLVATDPPRAWGKFTLVATLCNCKVWARPTVIRGGVGHGVVLATEILGDWTRSTLSERQFTKRFGYPITDKHWAKFPKSGKTFKRTTKTVMRGDAITAVKETLA